MNTYLLTFIFVYSFYIFNIYKIDVVEKYKFSILFLIFFVLTIFVGFRHIIGSDYGGYLYDFVFMKEMFYFDIKHNFFSTNTLEPIFSVLNYIVIYFGLEYEFLNLFIGCIFIFSITFFASKEKDYLFIILILLSYYFIIFGMGYVRQGLSLAFILLFIHFWRTERLFIALIFFLLAVGSHKFSIISGFVLLIRPKGAFLYISKYFYIFISIFLLIVVAKTFPLVDIKYYFDVYSQEKSIGAFYRTLAFFLCSLIFFYNLPFFKNRSDYRYLFISGIIILFIFVLSFFYSTISDRLIGYFLPFVFIVLSNLETINTKLRPGLIRNAIISLLFVHLFLWTNFSNQSKFYVPYMMVDYPGSIKIYNVELLPEIIDYDGSKVKLRTILDFMDTRVYPMDTKLNIKPTTNQY